MGVKPSIPRALLVGLAVLLVCIVLYFGIYATAPDEKTRTEWLDLKSGLLPWVVLATSSLSGVIAVYLPKRDQPPIGDTSEPGPVHLPSPEEPSADNAEVQRLQDLLHRSRDRTQKAIKDHNELADRVDELSTSNSRLKAYARS